jgi:hypothetical protein
MGGTSYLDDNDFDEADRTYFGLRIRVTNLDLCIGTTRREKVDAEFEISEGPPSARLQ